MRKTVANLEKATETCTSEFDAQLKAARRKHEEARKRNTEALTRLHTIRSRRQFLEKELNASARQTKVMDTSKGSLVDGGEREDLRRLARAQRAEIEALEAQLAS